MDPETEIEKHSMQFTCKTRIIITNIRYILKKSIYIWTIVLFYPQRSPVDFFKVLQKWEKNHHQLLRNYCIIILNKINK